MVRVSYNNWYIVEEKGRKSMKKTIFAAFLLVLFAVTTSMSLTTTLAMPTEMSVINPDTLTSDFIFTVDTHPVGTRFNATVWAYDYENVFAYQVTLNVDDSLLNITNAWVPNWDEAWIFAEVSVTMPVTPTFYDLDTDGYMETVKMGETILVGDPVAADTGFLAIVEFEIIYVPDAGSASCDLNIDNLDTYLLNFDLEEILATKLDGYYEIQAAAVEVAWINGTVTDADTTAPIEGATVEADGVSDLTDASGFYELEVAPGTYDVTASMMGYFSGTALGVSVAADETVTVDFALVPILVPEVPTIESCDSAGTKKDTFDLADDVYVTGSGYGEETTYDLYVVEDATWIDGMAIPARIPGTVTTITSDMMGDVPPTAVWLSPLTPGKYDIIVDVDGDGLYYAECDALDDNDIEVTAGFFVIPEYWIGTILALIGCFAAFGVFRITKRKQL